MKSIKIRILYLLLLIFVIQIFGLTLANVNDSLSERGVNSTVNNMSANNLRLKYMGQATIRIITEENKVIYIDQLVEA